MAPKPGRVWSERHTRALAARGLMVPQALAPAWYRPGSASPEDTAHHSELMSRVFQVEADLTNKLVLIDGGGWQPNPHCGDHARARRRRRELWAEVGDWLGIGPPPEDFFGER